PQPAPIDGVDVDPQDRLRRRVVFSRSALVVAALALALVGLGEPAQAVPVWAPAGSATVHPGVMTFTAGAQCTGNFVYTSGSDVYLGQAAHCSVTGAATDTN